MQPVLYAKHPSENVLAVFWLTCTGLICLTKSNIRLLPSTTILSQLLRHHILQIFFSCTLPPGLSAHLLIHASSAFRSDARISKSSALFLILALSSGIGFHFLSAMLRLSSFKSQLKTHLFSVNFPAQ